MNKKGYTLAEALITLGIIGIIAALIVPAANKARPNQNKIKFLQTYDTIETQIKNFTQNSRYFPTCQDFNDGNGVRCFPDYPLYNTSAGVVENRNGRNIQILRSTPDADPPDRPLPNNYNANFANDGRHKLCYLLADAMGGQVDIQGNICKFTASNGVRFVMGVDNNNGFMQVGTPFMVTNILFNVDINNDEMDNRRNWNVNFIDINNIALNNVLNNNGNIPDTRAFALFVFSDGTIIPATPVTAYYLATRNNQRDGNISVNDPSVRNIITNKYGGAFASSASIITYIIDRRLYDKSSFSQ